MAEWKRFFLLFTIEKIDWTNATQECRSICGLQYESLRGGLMVRFLAFDGWLYLHYYLIGITWIICHGLHGVSGSPEE
jgi:hypothetical protein